MPQILPFVETNALNSQNSKEKSDKFDIKNEKNTNEILAHLIKDNHDSLGHEIPHSFNSFISTSQTEPSEPAKKEKKKGASSNFDCEEGFEMGKLVIFKDKTAKMVCGDVEFDIVNGIHSEFSQEIMGIDFLEKGSKPKAYFLENIKRKFICKPNLDNLLG